MTVMMSRAPVMDATLLLLLLAGGFLEDGDEVL